MDPRMARRALGSALLCGIAADLLFHRVPLGINVPLATIATLAVVTWLGDRRTPDRLDLWLPPVAVLASLGPALRTDPSVVPLDLGLAAAAVAAWSFAVRGIAVTRRTATAVAALGAVAVVGLVTGFAALAGRAAADGYFSQGTRQLGRLAPMARGAVIAVPVVFGFALLLASADAVFGRALDDVLNLPVDLGDLIGRVVFSILAAVIIAGPIAIAAGAPPAILRAEALGGAPRSDAAAHAASGPHAGMSAAEGDAPDGTATGVAPHRQTDAPGGRRTGATETLIVLLAVDTLFAVFGLVQVIYLFGGADTLSAIGMTYSDYAREGYFQLAGVVALAGLLLLGAHEVMGRTRAFVVASMVLMALTGVILASAAFRLRLYQEAYGWTELRFFVAASIAWLAACVAIALTLIASGRMRWLPHGIAMSAIAITLAVTAVGPQAFVMHQNLARALDPSLVPPGGRTGLDVEYGLTLGDDAIPDMVAALSVLPASDGAVLLDQLRTRRAELEREAAGASPLSWNLSRERAREALARLP
jgi:Domain of unknown function (DUF4173)